MKQKGISLRMWASFLILGLVGQLAWAIENMYFNVFLYNTISKDTSYIAAMVAASGIVATVTTLFMGALSDRIGRRKAFISIGYILWGLATAAFGFLSVDSIGSLFPAANAVMMAALAVVVMDCIMTFFGSTANDAAFNAYITCNTTKENRGRVESVLATLPLIAMLLIFGLFDGMTKNGQWREFFLIFGAMVTLTGIVTAFLLPKETPVPKKDNYWKNIVYGFRPKVIKENKPLYIALAAFGLFCIAVQVFLPYLIIYIQEYLKIESYAIVLGIVLIVASIISVVFGRIIDKAGKLKFTLPALGVMFVGLIGMFLVRSFVTVIIAGIVMMGGNMLVSAALSGTIRDYTPSDKVGLFQGIRMIFQVLLPMIIGPYIGSFIIKNSTTTYIDEYNAVKQVPTPGIFLGAAAILLLCLIPIIILKRTEKEKQYANRLG
ncbi:MAG: MFS transporter [Clostridia bacterium]|nr:MFS transporter [Clostridia bacterium]